MRQYIAHRGGSFLQAGVDEKGKIKLLNIPVRFRYFKDQPKLTITDNSIELLDELRSIANFLNKSYLELEKQ